MLKIKDNVDLKELEKYGFEETAWGYIFYPNNNSPKTRYFSAIKIDINDDENSWLNRTFMFDLQNMSLWSNDLEQLDLDLENIEQSYETFKKVVDDLIKADSVVKVDD